MIEHVRDKIVLVLKGFCMGAADVVPGVSGGTMALVLGIYHRWLVALRSFDGVWLRHLLRLEWRGVFGHPHFGVLLPLLLGVACAILFFTRVIPLPALIHSHPEPIYGLFFGLIVGSIVYLLYESGRPVGHELGFIGLGIALGWFIVTRVPMQTPDAAWFIFLSGFIAICALMLPGISGSFILLIMRKYDTIFDAIGHFNLMILLPFAAGALAGFVVFSRLLSWLLEHYYRPALFSIVGILTGSLWVIWPFQQRQYLELRGKSHLVSSTPQWPSALDSPVLFALGMMLLGLALVLVLHRLAQRRQVADL